MDYVLGLSGFVFSAFCCIMGVGGVSQSGCYSGEEQVDFTLQLSSLFSSLPFLLTLLRSLTYIHSIWEGGWGGEVFTVSHISVTLPPEVVGYSESPKDTEEDTLELDWQFC